MATAGYCHQCGTYVYLDEQWSCPNGHGWNSVSGWYDADTRAPVTPPWTGQSSAQAPETIPEPAPDPAVLLSDLIRTRLEDLNLAPTETGGVYSANRGQEYECAMAVDGPHARVVFWERLRVGRDPGVRDALRTLTGEAWALKVVLRRDDVTI